MLRFLICFFVVFGLAIAPALASPCVVNCPAASAQQHDHSGQKNSDNKDSKAGTVHSCCHAHVNALPDRAPGVHVMVTTQPLAIGPDEHLASTNPTPPLEPPSRA